MVVKAGGLGGDPEAGCGPGLDVGDVQPCGERPCEAGARTAGGFVIRVTLTGT